MEKFFIDGAEDIFPSVNDSPYKRLLAIGDVHGTYDKLTSLLEKISVTENDRLIFLGDYLGDVNKKNLETLILLDELSKRENVTLLRGNTDEEALRIFSCDVEQSGKLFVKYFFRNRLDLI